MLEYIYYPICVTHMHTDVVYIKNKKRSPPPVFPRIPCCYSQHACKLQGEGGGAKMWEATWQWCLIFLFPLCFLPLLQHPPLIFSMHQLLSFRAMVQFKMEWLKFCPQVCMFLSLGSQSKWHPETKILSQISDKKPNHSSYLDHNDRYY